MDLTSFWPAVTSNGRRWMLDVLYVLGSVGFFALMLVYVVGCERLGAGGRARGEEGTK